MPLPTGSTWWLLPGLGKAAFGPRKASSKPLRSARSATLRCFSWKRGTPRFSSAPATGTQARRASRLRITLAFTA